MDDIGLHPAFSEPARQPEAVTPGLIGNDNALKRPTRFCGLVPPTLQKPEQRVPIRLKLLQRLAVNPGHDPCPDPCQEPACLAQASRPEEFHLRPLTERCGSLSAHTAPTKQPVGIRAVQ